MSKVQDKAYEEACREIERLKERSLSPQERGYLLGLLKEHLDYYRLLSGNGKCTAKSKANRQFLEQLVLKLTL